MSRRPRNASGNHPWVSLTDFDVEAMVRAVKPDVDRVLEAIAGRVADEARASTLFKDTNKTIDVYHSKKYEAKRTKPHKHLRTSIRPKKSRYDGWIVQAGVPHAHLVEYGHYIVRNGDLIGHAAPHPFLRKAKDAVEARLASRLGWDMI